MTPDEVLEAACNQTGLSEFESDSWREGLEILCDDHAKVGLLNEMGRGWYRELSVNALATRLKIDDHLRKHPEILECYTLMGETDFLLRIVCRDIKAYEAFFLDHLSRFPGVQSVNSSIALAVIKETTALPLRP